MIKLIKKYNGLYITPIKDVAGLLSGPLTYTRMVDDYSYKSRGPVFERVPLYSITDKSFITRIGLLTRIKRILDTNKLEYEFEDATPYKVIEPQLDRIEDVSLRDFQYDMIEVLLKYNLGQINGCTGLGKSTLIVEFTKLFPQEEATILIVVPSTVLLRSLFKAIDKIYPGEVGQLGGGKRTVGRITIATSRSLHNAPKNFWLVLYDEVHTAGAPVAAAELAQFKQSRMFGFSASTECRSDRADLLVESLFGPVRVAIAYHQAEEKGYVAKVDAFFYKVGVEPFEHSNRVIKKRYSIWRNEARNNAIKTVAEYWSNRIENSQIVILTQTLEHALYLKKLLPDYELIYSSTSGDKLDDFKRMGLLTADYKPLSNKQVDELLERVKSGECRKVIGTTVLGTGVDLVHLDVIIRADGGSTEVSNVQYRGRVSRGCRGVYCDFWIEGDTEENRKSAKRYRSCKSAKWTTEIVDLP